MCVLCTFACYYLQTIGQKYTSPQTSSILLTLESVFGSVISVIFYHEQLTVRELAGFVLIFIAVIISETKLEFLRGRLRRHVRSIRAQKTAKNRRALALQVFLCDVQYYVNLVYHIHTPDAESGHSGSVFGREFLSHDGDGDCRGAGDGGSGYDTACGL